MSIYDNPEGDMLRISEAAKRLGVSPATLRRWTKAGLLNAYRTPGGERRYDEADLDHLAKREIPRRQSGALASDAAFLEEDWPDAGEDDLADVPTRPATRHPVAPTPPWKARVNEAKADLDVAKLLREQAAMDHEEFLASSTRQRQRFEVMEAEQAAEASQQARSADKERLKSLLGYAETLVAISGAPIEYRMRATRELALFVTAEQFPATLHLVQAYAYLKAKVEQLFAPWRKTVADDKRLEDLVRKGRSHAARGTTGWDRTEAERAKREVERALREEVKAAWSEADVADLVDDTLDQWEE